SESSLERLTNFLQRARQSLGDNAPALPDVRDGYAGRSLDVPVEFAAALDDDLGVPRALSVVFASVTEGAKLLDSGTDSQQLARIVAEVELMLDILGVNPSAEAWAVTASDAKAESALEALIATMAERRAEAKAVKDFATADSIRDELAAAGVVIEDTADGYRYHLGQGRGLERRSRARACDPQRIPKESHGFQLPLRRFEEGPGQGLGRQEQAQPARQGPHAQGRGPRLPQGLQGRPEPEEPERLGAGEAEEERARAEHGRRAQFGARGPARRRAGHHDVRGRSHRLR